MNKLSHDTDLLNLPQHNLEVYVMYFGNKGIQQRPFTLYHFLVIPMPCPLVRSLHIVQAREIHYSNGKPVPWSCTHCPA